MNMRETIGYRLYCELLRNIKKFDRGTHNMISHYVDKKTGVEIDYEQGRNWALEYGMSYNNAVLDYTKV
jgi:hypothetical protein